MAKGTPVDMPPGQPKPDIKRRRRRPFRLAGRIRSHRSRRWGTATTPRLPPGRVSIRPLLSPRRKAGPPSSNRAGWSAGVGPGERYLRPTAP